MTPTDPKPVCPTCGSDDRKIRKHIMIGKYAPENTLWGKCCDPWHDSQPAEPSGPDCPGCLSAYDMHDESCRFSRYDAPAIENRDEPPMSEPSAASAEGEKE